MFDNNDFKRTKLCSSSEIVNDFITTHIKVEEIENHSKIRTITTNIFVNNPQFAYIFILKCSNNKILSLNTIPQLNSMRWIENRFKLEEINNNNQFIDLEQVFGLNQNNFEDLGDLFNNYTNEHSDILGLILFSFINNRMKYFVIYIPNDDRNNIREHLFLMKKNNSYYKYVYKKFSNVQGIYHNFSNFYQLKIGNESNPNCIYMFIQQRSPVKHQTQNMADDLWSKKFNGIKENEIITIGRSIQHRHELLTAVDAAQLYAVTQQTQKISRIRKTLPEYVGFSDSKLFYETSMIKKTFVNKKINEIQIVNLLNGQNNNFVNYELKMKDIILFFQTLQSYQNQTINNQEMVEEINQKDIDLLKGSYASKLFEDLRWKMNPNSFKIMNPSEYNFKNEQIDIDQVRFQCYFSLI